MLRSCRRLARADGGLAEAGIALSYLDPNGRFLARMEGSRSGNVLLRRRQYRVADDPAEAAAPIVRAIVTAKVANQRAVICRALRDYGGTSLPEWRETMQKLSCA